MCYKVSPKRIHASAKRKKGHLARIAFCALLAGCFCLGLDSQAMAQERERVRSCHGMRIRNGDLIFQEACGGNTEDAIKSVTSSAEDYNFTHVGMVCIQGGEAYVLEATVPCVALTPIRDFLYPETDSCPPVSVLARLKPEYRKLIPEALRLGLGHLGKSYDYAYVLGDDRYYCSELIYQILKDANHGKEVFPLNVMTFCDSTGRVLPAWEAYFKQHSAPVPEGEAGINPGAMSRSKVLRLLRSF